MSGHEGKVALISGVARGQGRSHAVRLAREGVDIIGFDICADIPSNGYPMATRAELDETVDLVKSEGRRMVARVADARDYFQVRSVLDEGLETFGRVDIVLANAGIAPMAFRELTIEEELEQWADTINVNLAGAFHTVKNAIPHLISGGRGGSIVFTSSTAGLRGFGGEGASGLAYSASKHGVVGLMRSLANALAAHNIRVNTVHPTAVRTMMAVNPGMVSFLENNPGAGPHLRNPMPIDMLEPGDISDAIVWLTSDEGKWVSGTTLPVDAGFSNKL